MKRNTPMIKSRIIPHLYRLIFTWENTVEASRVRLSELMLGNNVSTDIVLPLLDKE